MQILAGGSLLLTLAIAILLVIRREHPIVKGASRSYCATVLSGIALGFSSTFILLGKPTSLRCNLFQWFYAISFALIMSNLLLKYYRYWRIFSVQELLLTDSTIDRGTLLKMNEKNKKLTHLRVFLYSMLIIACQCVILGIVVSLFPVNTEIRNVENDQYARRRLVCEDGLEVKSTILVMDLLFLAAGATMRGWSKGRRCVNLSSD